MKVCGKNITGYQAHQTSKLGWGTVTTTAFGSTVAAMEDAMIPSWIVENQTLWLGVQRTTLKFNQSYSMLLRFQMDNLGYRNSMHSEFKYSQVVPLTAVSYSTWEIAQSKACLIHKCWRHDVILKPACLSLETLKCRLNRGYISFMFMDGWFHINMSNLQRKDFFVCLWVAVPNDSGTSVFF